MQNIQNRNVGIESIQYRSGAINVGDCISNGWNLAGQQYGLFLGIAFLAGVMLFIIGVIPILSVFLTAILSGPILAGVYYVFIKEMNGEPIDFGMMFQGFNVFVAAMMVSILQSLPWIGFFFVDLTLTVAGLATAGLDSTGTTSTSVLLGMSFLRLFIVLIAFLISVAIYISTFFALQLIVEHNLSGIDAIKLSASAAWSNLGGIILLFIVEFFMIIAGLLACIIGVIFISPVLYAANAFAYRQVFPQFDSPMQNVPPPPTEYGNFGQGL